MRPSGARPDVTQQRRAALLGVHLAALVAHRLQGMGPNGPAGAAQLFGSAGAVLDLQGKGGGMV